MGRSLWRQYFPESHSSVLPLWVIPTIDTARTADHQGLGEATLIVGSQVVPRLVSLFLSQFPSHRRPLPFWTRFSLFSRPAILFSPLLRVTAFTISPFPRPSYTEVRSFSVFLPLQFASIFRPYLTYLLGIFFSGIDLIIGQRHSLRRTFSCPPLLGSVSGGSVPFIFLFQGSILPSPVS